MLMAGRPDVVGGHYHVGKRIGEGSFGVIYQGVNDLNGKKVAMKFVPDCVLAFFVDVVVLRSLGNVPRRSSKMSTGHTSC